MCREYERWLALALALVEGSGEAVEWEIDVEGKDSVIDVESVADVKSGADVEGCADAADPDCIAENRDTCEELEAMVGRRDVVDSVPTVIVLVTNVAEGLSEGMGMDDVASGSGVSNEPVIPFIEKYGENPIEGIPLLSTDWPDMKAI